MSIEDRDYFHKDRARRASVLADKGKPLHRIDGITWLARSAVTRDSTASRWLAFVAGVCVGAFGTVFVLGLLKL